MIFARIIRSLRRLLRGMEAASTESQVLEWNSEGFALRTAAIAPPLTPKRVHAKKNFATLFPERTAFVVSQAVSHTHEQGRWVPFKPTQFEVVDSQGNRGTVSHKFFLN